MIALPVLPRGTVLNPRLVRTGGDLVSALGGPTQRITRVGSRFSLGVQLPTLDRVCAARWVEAALKAEAIGDTLGLVVPQIIDVTGLDQLTGTGVAGSASMEIAGAAFTPSAGTWFSVKVGGRHYLHTITDMVDADTAHVAPLLRASFTATPLMVSSPVIEGYSDAIEWSSEWFRFVGHSFTITESA